MQPDVVGVGHASDHSIAIARQNLDKALRTGFSRTEIRSRRVVMASSLAMLGLFLLSFNWQVLYGLRRVSLSN